MSVNFLISSILDDVFANGVDDQADDSDVDECDETEFDEFESGDENEDEDDSISLDDVQHARRQILDPSKQQKLRKGFRMASICWDD